MSKTKGDPARGQGESDRRLAGSYPDRQPYQSTEVSNTDALGDNEPRAWALRWDMSELEAMGAPG